MRTRHWLGIVALVSLAVVSGCSDGADPSSGLSTRSAGADDGVVDLVPFDPPTAFDRGGRVTLSSISASDPGLWSWAAVLEGSTFVSVESGKMVARDVTDGRVRWSIRVADNPDRASGSVALVRGGSTVVSAVGGTSKGEGTSLDSWGLKVTCVDLESGDVEWQRDLPLPEGGFAVFVSDSSAGILVTYGATQGVTPLHSWMIDPATGEILWDVDGRAKTVGDGSFGLLVGEDDSARVVDLKTGNSIPSALDTEEIAVWGSDQWKVIPLDGSRSVARVFGLASLGEYNEYYSFFSVDSATGAVAPVEVGEYDIRREEWLSCSLEDGRSVMLCSAALDRHGALQPTHDSAFGVVAASGEVVWSLDGTSRRAMSDAVQFHGAVYGRVDGDTGVAVDLETGEDVNSGLGLVPQWVNEYGAVVQSEKLIEWYPASG